MSKQIKRSKAMGPYPIGTSAPPIEVLSNHLQDYLTWSAREGRYLWVKPEILETFQKCKTPWKPISTAPKDGTKILWLHVITVLGKSYVKFDPSISTLERQWIGKKEGDGFWMGEYGSVSDSNALGWWNHFNPA
jgi:hypothetical protein